MRKRKSDCRKGRTSKCIIWGKSIMSMTSFDDMDDMVSTLLVISALIMSFIVAMMLGIQRSDLEEGDRVWIEFLNMTSKPWVLTIDSGGIWHTTIDPFKWNWNYGGFVSHIIAFRCIEAVGQLVTVIFVLMATYFSLHISRARDDKKLFQKWMVSGWVLVIGSIGLFFKAFFTGATAIGNAMGILYPAIRRHNTYEELLAEVKSGNHFGAINFAVEPIAQSYLNDYAWAGITVGGVGGLLAFLMASSCKERNSEMSDFLNRLKDSDCNDDKSDGEDGADNEIGDIDDYLRIFLRERLSFSQLKVVTAEQLNGIGIPLGDALRIIEAAKSECTSRALSREQNGGVSILRE
jgi:hypothetical protein